VNVCALDVVSRTPDFESIAATLELRGWEWDLLHDVDGTTPLGEVARRRGIDLDAAIGLVHEATHRGLLAVGTMSLAAYRQLTPMQPAFAPAPRTLSLGTSAVATPLVTPPAPAVSPAAAFAPASPPAPAPASTGAISFSSDSFDWDAPEPGFDEPEAQDALAASASVVHEEHAAFAHDEPATIAHDEPDEIVQREPVGVVHYDDRFGIEHEDGPFAAPSTGPVDDPFAVPASAFDEPVTAEPAPAQTVEAEHAPFGYAHDDDPFAVAHHEFDAGTAPAAFPDARPQESQAVEDPFAAAPRAFYSFAAPETAAPPTSNGKSASFGTPSSSHNGVAHVATETEPEPAPVHAGIETPSGADESVPGSISFSFAPGDPIDAHEAPPEAPVSRATVSAQAPTSAAAPEEAIADAEGGPATVPHDQPDPVPSITQSTFYEREAVDTDAGRELQEKAKTWKESLSWREQQQLHEAMETGKEKPGVIGSILRALGVR
jgi:hypothetical protein